MKRISKSKKIKLYESNPVYCKYCSKIIPYSGRETLDYINSQKYCSLDCYHKSKILKENCGIYCIENIKNGKKYIGKSKNISRRFSQHKSKLNKNQHTNSLLQDDWNKYGEINFKFYLLEECEENEQNPKEQYWIQKLNTYDCGYNKDLGGVVGRWSGDNKKKMSESQNKYFQDDKNKEKHIKQCNKLAIPIYQISLDGNIIKLWENGAREVQRVLGYSQGNIKRVVDGIKKSAYGYIWVKQSTYDGGDFDLNYYMTKQHCPHKVYQYDLQYNLISEYKNAYETKNFGFDPSSVLKACKKTKKTYKDYIWSFNIIF